MKCSTEVIGILLMLASGVSVTSQMAISKMIEEMQWPYWYLLASSCLMAGVVNALHVWCLGIACPQRKDIKWVLARAVFENFHWIGAMLSVIVGAAPGDVAALTSIDIIAAALLGLVFLGERVSILHLFALILSVAGALCISQPQFLFGSIQGAGESPAGYCIALLSGCFQACSFVCARKSAHIPVSLLSLVSLLLSAPAALLVPLVQHEHSAFGVVMERPWQAIWLLLTLTVWISISILLPAAGATRCPAAVSATVFTAASMITGYLAQTVLFHNAPKPLKLVGAFCMLCSVVLMAIRCQAKESEGPSCAESVSEAATAAEDDENLSLGSFVASEVSFTSSSSRLRRRASSFKATEPLAQRFGACLPIAASSA
ncbi:putative transport protein [Symbiodinium microadriaticum]|uniref:Putative transport protein n=1 Tax=Symbiodinium microadriaticum TaxID=2951 RepID=A0A1Q9CTS1_SYMMI|nr:putative transport protein [Symbiodinium microadriaticum]CAE7302870.1 unnamed protein product [Symbiodinium sp. KB8]